MICTIGTHLQNNFEKGEIIELSLLKNTAPENAEVGNSTRQQPSLIIEGQVFLSGTPG